jgi:hypothetical protein
VTVLPRLSGANAIWLCFVVIQALDGVLTVVGMNMFGQTVEANPVIAFYAATFGPEVAIAGSKLLAIGCGSALHLCQRHRIVAALCVFYTVAAIAPWSYLLLRTAY